MDWEKLDIESGQQFFTLAIGTLTCKWRHVLRGGLRQATAVTSGTKLYNFLACLRSGTERHTSGGFAIGGVETT
jgi:hypothetical protein